MSRGAEIKVVGFVPDGNGGYQSLEGMAAAEKTEYGKQLSRRMGVALNDYFSAHPVEYERI